MRLLLVRHGESVDNVAGLYAGSRDSPLTSHGMLQARRLGEHLAARSASTGPLLHVFASDLQRAALTAQAIVDAHLAVEAESESELETPQASLTVVEVTDLRERDFRSSEGVKFGLGIPLPDAETHPEMHARVVRFIEIHLDPILKDAEGPVTGSLVVVAHGLILNVLLSALLSRFAPTELERLISTGRGSTEYLLPWNNTGFVEALIHADSPTLPVDIADVTVEEPGDETRATSTTPNSQASIRLEVVVMNSVEHLKGLKKTRGGIGSAKFDSKQKTMDSFFKPVGKQ